MLSIDADVLLRFALIFIRIGALFSTLPFFSESVIPVRVKILLSLAIAFAFYPAISQSWSFHKEFTVMNVLWCILGEVFVGLSLGYVAKLFFEGVVMSANLVGYQMGFGTASLILPGSDAEISSFTALHRILVLLIFLGMSFHYIFLQGIKATFDYIPAGTFKLDVGFMTYLITTTGAIFKIALQLSAPILMALLFAMAALGLIARTVPQVNVFVLSFPLSFFVGLALYVITLKSLPDWLNKYYQETAANFLNSIYSFAP